MIQNYQKSLDTLKKLLSVMYEIKTKNVGGWFHKEKQETGLLYTSPSPRDYAASRMPSSA
ncbi:hypothetical protein JMUB7513_27380 [Staphylococcus aureus]